jgi:hypothetical protein
MTAPAITLLRATRIWNGIESVEPPALAHDYPRLLAMAEEMLATRCQRFPDLIAQGRIAQRDGDLEILAFEYLVRTWRFIVSGEGEPAGHGADHILRAAIDEAIARIADFAAERGGFSETLGAKAEAVIALRWHLEPGRKTIALARLTHQLRADARAAITSRRASA